MNPRREVVADGIEHVVNGGEFRTLDAYLARAVAARLDLVDPLPIPHDPVAAEDFEEIAVRNGDGAVCITYLVSGCGCSDCQGDR